MSRRRAAWLPTETQELLLRAAVEEDDEVALAAWRRWTELVDPAEPEGADLQILPLISRRLARLDPDDPSLDRLKGLHRWSWAHNQLLLELGSRVIAELEEEGIETLVLKGAALSLHNYPDLGARQMQDLDFLVRVEAVFDAMAVLRRSMEPHEWLRPGIEPERRVPIHHSAGFADRTGLSIDLHWYSLHQSSPDDDFWADAVPIDILGTPSRALSPADQLLQVCVHGACWQPVTSLRWITDAILVLRSDPAPDWDRFVAQAVKRELTLTAADALGYLRSAFAVPIPDQVMRDLGRAPVSLTARAARHAVTRPTTVTGHLRVHWERYRRLRRLAPSTLVPRSFPAHLKTAWGFGTYREFGAYAARRTVERRR